MRPRQSSRLTPERVAQLTSTMKPQSGDTIILVFVHTTQDQYLMCAPIQCSWMEAIAAITDEHPALALRNRHQ